jgi:hypothetical protein
MAQRCQHAMHLTGAYLSGAECEGGLVVQAAVGGHHPSLRNSLVLEYLRRL